MQCLPNRSPGGFANSPIDSRKYSSPFSIADPQPSQVDSTRALTSLSVFAASYLFTEQITAALKLFDFARLRQLF
jgi:hypothetical protein